MNKNSNFPRNNKNNNSSFFDKVKGFFSSAKNKTAEFFKNVIPKKKSSKLKDAEIKVDTDANIRKAQAKRKAKKTAGVSLIILKKTLQWTLNICLTLLLVGTICSIIIGGYVYNYVLDDLVIDDYDIDPAELKNDLSKTSWVYYDTKYDTMYTDENGEPLYAPIEIYGTENRVWMSYNDIPEDLVNAFIAIEDERYFEHNGVDWRRTFGAIRGYLTGNDTYGGSTITQQLIKNVTGDDETTAERKITEIFRALSLSEKRTKNEVLEMYLNKIHLSRSNYGVWAAAKFYFGKDIAEGDELTLSECAALASIPKSPTKYDPVRNPADNKERRQLVLKKMYELEMISEEEYKKSKNEDIKLNITYEETQKASSYSYFTDALIEQVVEDLGEEYGYSKEEAFDLIYTGGLTIYSTEDPGVQRKMEEVFNDPDTFKKVDDGVQPQSAMVVMNPYTGEVVGIVGGRGAKEGKRERNRATQSVRQVGSSIKPLTVYSPAIDHGIINYGTTLDDTPVFMEKMNRYWPYNSPNRYDGHISVNEAVGKSKNTTAVKLIQEMGVDYVYDFAKNTLHLESLVTADKDVAPLALGGFTYGLTVMEMAAAYTIFPNEGYYSPPRLYTKVLRPDGTVLLDRSDNEEEYAIKKETSAVMTKILENVVVSGTAAKIQLKNQINCAGKTGSTNDNKDVYFCGFTPYYVGACWFGYDIPKDLTKFGTNPAMLAWEAVMKEIHQPYFDAAKDPENPVPLKSLYNSKLVPVQICKDSGLVPSANCSLDPRGDRIITGYYYEGKEPERTCNVHAKVRWCTESNMPAGIYCPNITEAAMVRESGRDFEHGEIKVTDEAYVYNPMKELPTCTLHLPPEPVLPEEIPEEIPEELPEDMTNTEINDSDYDPTLDNISH